VPLLLSSPEPSRTWSARPTSERDGRRTWGRWGRAALLDGVGEGEQARPPRRSQSVLSDSAPSAGGGGNVYGPGRVCRGGVFVASEEVCNEEIVNALVAVRRDVTQQGSLIQAPPGSRMRPW